jgi:hypothetical protein
MTTINKQIETVLQEADRIVSTDRGAAYGHPLDDYTKTGTIWGAMLHGWAKEAAESTTPVPVPPELACLMMIGVKLSREVNAHKRDNLVDTAGYAKCVQMIHEERTNRMVVQEDMFPAPPTAGELQARYDEVVGRPVHAGLKL